MTMLDQRLIDQRRIAAGLTIWQLADRLGLNVEVVRSLTEIEEFSRDSEQLDRLGFGTIRHLCTLLDIDLNQLLASTDRERPPTAAADDVKVEAALADHGTAVTQEDLAATLGWPLPRLQAALHMLERRCLPTGVRLRRVGWNSYALTANLQALSGEQTAHLHRAHGDHQPLTPHAAATLLAAIERVDHTAWLEHEFYGQHREGVQFLQQHGLVTADRPGMQPSDDVIFSLRLRYWGYEPTDDPAAQSDAALAGRAGERS